MFFGVGANGKFNPYPLEEKYHSSPYVDEKLIKDGQVCVVQEQGNDRIVGIYVKTPAGLTNIFNWVVKDGKHVIDFIWPK